MNKPLAWVLVVAGLVLGLAGVAFFATSVDTMARPETRTPATVAGITCLVLATGILILGVFVSRKRD